MDEAVGAAFKARKWAYRRANPAGRVNAGSLGVVLPARTVGQLDLGVTRLAQLVRVIEREV
jgi:hypothetical protein